MTPHDPLAPESNVAELHAELVEAERFVRAADWEADWLRSHPDPSEYEERSWR